MVRASIQPICCTEGVVGGNPASMEVKTALLKTEISHSMHQPLILKDPPLSMYIPNVMFGVRSGELRDQFCKVSNPLVARLASLKAAVRGAEK